MKKLLTILVSAASACFAFADGFTESGTSFESYVLDETGFAELKLSDQDADGKRYWLSGAQSDFGIVTNYQSDTAIPSDITRPTKFASETNNKYLRLDTSDTLFRTINSYVTSDATEGTEAVTTTMNAVNIGDKGIYFDSLVQFTATEDDVAPSDDGKDKLIVWLKAVEGTEDALGSTNLMITAGNGVDGLDNAIRADFVASGVTIKPNSWHRLTIKAFVRNGNTFFNVYIDGAPVTGALEGVEGTVTDFESLVSVANTQLSPTTISAVGFKGNGAVDDLVFTTSNPLGFSVTATIAGDNEVVAPSKYSVDGLTWVDVTFGSPFTVPASTANITFKVFIAEGYELDGGDKTNETDNDDNYAWTKTVSVSSVNNAITLTVKAAQVEPAKPFSITIGETTTTYETLNAAFTAAPDGATIKLTADATVAEWLKVDKNVVLDLNGCTLTEEVDPEDSDYGAIYVKLNCQLTITDSSNDQNGKIASNGDIVIGNYGTVIVEAGTIESGDARNKDVSIYNMNYAGTHVGTANINGGAVESVWNCGTITVAAGASVTYLDNSGAATIAAGATVAKVVLMDGKDAQGVKDAGTITAPETLVVESGVEGSIATYNDGVWSLVAESDDPEPELPTPGVAEGEEINQTYEDEAKAAIKDAFTTGGTFTPPPALVVEVNGEVLLGNAAVEMINEVTKVFDITEGKFFDANGKMEVTFKATSADPAKITYEAKVGEANATVDAAYEVVPKYIDLATGKETTPAQDATAKFFKLVIRAKSVQ